MDFFVLMPLNIDMFKTEFFFNSFRHILTSFTNYSRKVVDTKSKISLLVLYSFSFVTRDNSEMYKFYKLFISSYTVVTPNTLNPFSYPDIVHITLVEVNLMACFLRYPTLLQFSSLKSILDSVLRMTHL